MDFAPYFFAVWVKAAPIVFIAVFVFIITLPFFAKLAIKIASKQMYII
jgi:hypothetical protein